MLVFRSFAVGLLAACFIVLAYRPSVQIFMPRPPPTAARAPAPWRVAPEPVASIVDVAHGLAPSQVASLVLLAPGERIVTVDDRGVSSNPDEAIALLDALAADSDGRRRYVDLSVFGPRGARRVLVLLH